MVEDGPGYAGWMRVLGRIIDVCVTEMAATPGMVGGPDMDEGQSIELNRTMRELSTRGLVSLRGPGGGLWFAQPTVAGQEAHSRYARLRGSRVHRRQHFRAGYLRWIDDNVDARGWVDADGFLDSGMHWHGDPVTEADLREAGVWLYGKGLIDGLEIDQRDDPVQVRLTQAGLDAVERGTDLSTLGQEPSASSTSATSYVNHNYGPAMIAQGGSGVTQTQHVGGDLGELARVMAVAIELLRPSMEAAAAEEFAKHAEVLREEALRGAEADEGRTRGVFTRIAEGAVIGAATGAGEAAVLALSTLATAMLGGA